MMFEQLTQSNHKSALRETWIEKDVYVEIEGDKIRFYQQKPSYEETQMKDVRVKFYLVNVA